MPCSDWAHLARTREKPPVFVGHIPGEVDINSQFQGFLLLHTSRLGKKGERRPSQLLVLQVGLPPPPHAAVLRATWSWAVESRPPTTWPACIQGFVLHLIMATGPGHHEQPHQNWNLNCMHPSLWDIIPLASLRLSIHKNDCLITILSLSYYHFPPYSAKSPWSVFILISLQTLLTPFILSPFSIRPSSNLG